jgi:hypothetical protein
VEKKISNSERITQVIEQKEQQEERDLPYCYE